MDIRTYAFTKKISLAQIARDLKKSDVYIRKIAAGTVSCGWKLALQIERYSEGLITMEELLPMERNLHNDSKCV